ncbi:MAG TPA: hypothetical protein VGD14_10515 [bacterium]
MKQKIKHPTIVEIISFATGELSLDRAELVRNHVQDCKKCTSNLMISKMFQSLGKRRSSESLKTVNHSCLDETAIANFVSGKSMPKSTRNLIVQHLAQCNSCRVKSVELFHEYSNLGIERQEFISELSEGRNRSRDKWWLRLFSHLYGIFPNFKSLRWAMIGPAIIFFSIITFLITQRSNKDADIWLKPVTTLREADDSSARRFILKKPDNGQVLNKDKFIHFKWPKIAGIKKYIILIYAMNGDLIWEFETESTSTVFKETALLQSGKSYFWQVAAISVAGKPCFSEMRSFVKK